MMSSVIIVAGCVVMNLKGALLVGVFTNDADVIFTGQSILKLFSWAYWVLPIVQILNGALRGAGKSRIPMYFMVGSFVVLRQIYLMIAVPMTHRLMTVMAGWPITWVICAAGMLIYFLKADWLLEAEEAAGDNVCER